MTKTRYESTDTHKTDLRGIRVVTNKPYLVNTDGTNTEYHSIGAVAYDVTNNVLHINTTGTIYGWKQISSWT